MTLDHPLEDVGGLRRTNSSAIPCQVGRSVAHPYGPCMRRERAGVWSVDLQASSCLLVGSRSASKSLLSCRGGSAAGAHEQLPVQRHAA